MLPEQASHVAPSPRIPPATPHSAPPHAHRSRYIWALFFWLYGIILLYFYRRNFLACLVDGIHAGWTWTHCRHQTSCPFHTLMAPAFSSLAAMEWPDSRMGLLAGGSTPGLLLSVCRLTTFLFTHAGVSGCTSRLTAWSPIASRVLLPTLHTLPRYWALL